MSKLRLPRGCPSHLAPGLLLAAAAEATTTLLRLLVALITRVMVKLWYPGPDEQPAAK